jgi:hypothetical protein
MDAFVAWLQTTHASRTIVLQPWVWPVCESLHFIGLAMLLGGAGFFDLRLLGCFRRISIDAARAFLPFATGGLVINLLTGAVFLIGRPEQYVHNPAWWAKVACLGVAVSNALVFRWTIGTRIAVLGPDETLPPGAKYAGAVSLAAWLGVLYWGRMLPFIGDAF